MKTVYTILDLFFQAYLLLVILLLAASWFHFLRRKISSVKGRGKDGHI